MLYVYIYVHAMKLEYATNQYFKFQEQVIFDIVIILLRLNPLLTWYLGFYSSREEF